MSTTRLQPTAPNADNAILVGDPGRALALAQIVLEEPKMSNHARGLWGYTSAAFDTGLTVQATGMGGPSAVAVLADLASLGVRRAVRVGTCRSLGDDLEPGAMVLADPIAGFDGVTNVLTMNGDSAVPSSPTLDFDPPEGVTRVGCASIDLDPAGLDREQLRGFTAGSESSVADMQSAPLAAACSRYRVDFAAVLVVEWGAKGERLDQAGLDPAIESAGVLAAGLLDHIPNPKVKG